MTRNLGIGVVGAGFMGRAHLAAYALARAAGLANRVVAVSGRGLEDGAVPLAESGAARGNLGLCIDRAALGLEQTRFTSDPVEILERSDVDAVSICTPTDTHVELAEAALRAGKHVLVEKPVALRSSDVERLLEVSRSVDRLCMPAMCMRFWPGWDWLRERVADGALGRVTSAVFRRLGSAPDWSRDFYGDDERSGGALFDLHVHDADFVQHCFGTPLSVCSRGTRAHVASTYAFADGPALVLAEGGWDHAPGFPFHMGFTVVFERATAEFASGRDAPLTLSQAGETAAVALAPGNGYDGEVRHFLGALANGAATVRPSLEEALAVTRLLEAEERSLASGRAERP